MFGGKRHFREMLPSEERIASNILADRLRMLTREAIATKADEEGVAAVWREFVAAGPVSRILSAGSLPQDGHSSGPRITARLKRPTRRL